MRYSGFRVFAEALRGQRGWKPVWRDPEPKPEYDVVIIGGGGHGLSTAYYLAKNGMTDTVLVEAEYLSCGATGRCGGGIRQQWSTEANTKLAIESVKAFAGLEEETAAAVFGMAEGPRAPALPLLLADGERGTGRQSMESDDRLPGTITPAVAVVADFRYLLVAELTCLNYLKLKRRAAA